MHPLPPLPSAKQPASSVAKDPDDRIGIPSQGGDPIKFLEAVMDCPKVSLRARMTAAASLLPYKHGKIAEQGKKESQKDRAVTASGGKFKRQEAPPTFRPTASH